MRKLFDVVTALVMATTAIPTCLQAQRDTLRERVLNEVVVSASRQEERIIDVPRTITVIGRDKVENAVYNSVGDLLAKQQGIYLVGANQTPGTNQSLFLRGANSNQVVVLIDGVRITDPSTPNNAVDLSELSLTNVERIEIIEGAHSTMYGGAAIGGVVNIITRKNQAAGFHGFVGIQGGTFGDGSGTLSQQIDLNYSAGNGFYATGSLFNQDVKGLRAAIDTTKGRRPFHRDGFRKTDSYGKLGYRKNGWDIFASYKNVNQYAQIPAAAFTDDDNNSIAFRRNLVNYSASYQFNAHWKIAGVGSWSNSRRDNVNDSSKVNATQYDGNFSRSRYNGRLVTDEFQVNYTNASVQAMMGSGIFDESMSFNTYFYSSSFGGYTATTNYDTLHTKASNAYVFGHVAVHIGPQKKIGLAGGGRYTHHSLFGSYGTYEFNPSYALSPSSLLFGSVASGFNAPSLYQLYDPSKDAGSFTTRGNRDLKPERSVSFEVGLKKQFGTGVYLTASIFHTNVSHVIEYVYLWNKATDVSLLTYSDYLGDTYLNLTQQKVSGVEVAGNWILTQKLSLNGNFTWLQGQMKFSPQDIDQTKTGGNHVQVYSNGAFLNQDITSKDLVRRPRSTAFAEIRYLLCPSLTLSADYRLAGARFDSAYDPSLGPYGALNQLKVNSYQLIDAGLNWRTNGWFTLTGKVENIFNQPYHEIQGYATRGRCGYIKLNFKW